MTTEASQQYPVTGAGIGLRRGMIDKLMANPPSDVDFMEVAPENWIHVGGSLGKKLRFFTERYPFLIHGLSLSIGAPSPLNETLLRDVKAFMQEHGIRFYSEHLSYTGDDGQLYDLMPIPFTEEAVHYVAARIRRAQDILEQRMAVENVSYYAPTDSTMTEADFTNAILQEADCDLLLDVNNIFVNSINHGYDAREFMRAMPAERIRYFHVAGHYVEAEDLRIDTHGDAIADPVWDLLGDAYSLFGAVPTLLERDFNLPPVEELLGEVRRIKSMQDAVDSNQSVAGASRG
jgi:uncharacterized protein (UPF0276 family)